MRHCAWSKAAGFTLLELLVVLAIVAIGSAGVGFALQDSTQSQLEREGLRLSALLEAARAQSRLSGVPVHWRTSEQGFRFDGLNRGSQLDSAQSWLNADTRASVEAPRNPRATVQAGLLLGPEPIIEPQSITLSSRRQPERRVRLATDGVRPFAIAPLAP